MRRDHVIRTWDHTTGKCLMLRVPAHQIGITSASPGISAYARRRLRQIERTAAAAEAAGECWGVERCAPETYAIWDPACGRHRQVTIAAEDADLAWDDPGMSRKSQRAVRALRRGGLEW